MLTLIELSELLTKSECDYEIIQHDKPILKTEDADEYFDSSKAAPVFIVKTEKGFYAMILSNQYNRIDFKKLALDLGFSKIKLAEKSDVLKVTGYEVGSIPLIGHDLPCLFDKVLLAFDYIYGGTGNKFHTLKIKPQEIIKLSSDVVEIENINRENHIQKATKGDLQEILTLQKAAFKPVSIQLNNPNIPPMLQSYEDMHSESEQNIILKYTINNTIVGSVRGRLDENNNCRIGKLIVHPQHQNKGIGKALMNEIEQYVNTCKKYILFTGLETPNTVYLYTKLGYKEVSNENSEGISMVIMEKINN
ncbi:prolyl-tRNA editing enzyme YbaK/EbsC (Cys-tRNA(Pro) deacylase) [Dysgonomonas alginatilytica]|uniref:Prolyl-tRNA editing enzyme YbaK/EbsC (Cys-tRNA(Pro) deacylase) n=1 Tax=Dysgonomonas alginatilytica TaxID=1605892 RepID=A0A2V3PKE0_9BACT|nr:GNAT family N-acetyltransferase [Dysgonomonas alginatilytica]PXV59369.1 prolyl-tRNA editing enzyme YbaK/EbsC (Cys-tRNA(Pro) deacylase) [Dysgonomonas alginatilytica]